MDQTREAAIAVSEDFYVLHDTFTKSETRAANLRNTSAILRRWLVENQLARVASPRVGRIHVEANNNDPIYRECHAGRILSFVSGGAEIHGSSFTGLMMPNDSNRPVLNDYHPEKLERFKLSAFSKQKVLYSNEQWFSRQQIIKFIANADHGVHGHGAREEWEKRLAEFRDELLFALDVDSEGNLMPSIIRKDGKYKGDKSLLKYSPTTVNGLLFELLSTVHFLVKSSDVINLMEVIKLEIA